MSATRLLRVLWLAALGQVALACVNARDKVSSGGEMTSASAAGPKQPANPAGASGGALAPVKGARVGEDCAGTAGTCAGLQRITCGPGMRWTPVGPPCGTMCRDGGCFDCEPGTRRCNDKTPQRCTDERMWVDDGPPCMETCDPTNGVCLGACAMNTTQCVSTTEFVTCAGDAWSFDSIVKCDSVCIGQACTAGCVPGTQRCANAATVQSCTVEGTWAHDEACAKTNTTCLGATSACDGECGQGQARCKDPTTRQTCSTDGKWVDEPCAGDCVGNACMGECHSGTSACTDDNLAVRHCADGKWGPPMPCKPACLSDANACGGECTPGAKQCVDATHVQVCDKGHWTTSECLYACVDDGRCDGGCKPGKTQCNGTTLRTCGPRGEWQDMPCPLACVDGMTGVPAYCGGVCMPRVTKKCVSNRSYVTCGDNGMFTAATQDCHFACVDDDCGGSCVPGDTQCVGTIAQRCNDRGQWENTNGTECLKGLGASCSSDSECLRPFCRGGHCCASDCAPSGPCGNIGTCDGSGSCTKAARGSHVGCSPPMCSNSRLFDAGRCDGNGGCAPGPDSPCPNGFTCQDSSSCNTTCTPPTGGCPAGKFCNGGSCQNRKGRGSLCANAFECTADSQCLQDATYTDLRCCPSSCDPAHQICTSDGRCATDVNSPCRKDKECIHEMALLAVCCVAGTAPPTCMTPTGNATGICTLPPP
jgi:hypothetical protein